jgi:hypothetical protein
MYTMEEIAKSVIAEANYEEVAKLFNKLSDVINTSEKQTNATMIIFVVEMMSALIKRTPKGLPPETILAILTWLTASSLGMELEDE